MLCRFALRVSAIFGTSSAACAGEVWLIYLRLSQVGTGSTHPNRASGMCVATHSRDQLSTVVRTSRNCHADWTLFSN